MGQLRSVSDEVAKIEQRFKVEILTKVLNNYAQ